MIPKMKKNFRAFFVIPFSILLIECLFCSMLKAQDTTFHKIKISGYIQTQYQYAGRDADRCNFKLSKTANTHELNELKNFGRFGIRRGRLKFTFDDRLVQSVFLTNTTENEISLMEADIKVKDPWIGTCSFKAGIFECPFGYEISYSSSSIESTERARITQTLFPDECDLGFMFTLQAPESSPWHILKFESGWFSGNGIRPQMDSHMDFVSRLSLSKKLGNDIVASGGISAYIGGVMQQDSAVFVVKNHAFVLDSKAESNIGKYAQRRYAGLDAQLRMITASGLSILRAEYICGVHPGNADGAYKFKFSSLPPAEPVYVRHISGGYVILVQELGKIPCSAVVKYDWYHPNTEISGNAIESKGEINMSNIGFALLWTVNPAIRLSAYYDICKNETSGKLTDIRDTNGKITEYGYDKDRKDNVFTLRLQYKF